MQLVMGANNAHTVSLQCENYAFAGVYYAVHSYLSCKQTCTAGLWNASVLYYQVHLLHILVLSVVRR